MIISASVRFSLGGCIYLFPLPPLADRAHSPSSNYWVHLGNCALRFLESADSLIGHAFRKASITIYGITL